MKQTLVIQAYRHAYRIALFAVGANALLAVAQAAFLLSNGARAGNVLAFALAAFVTGFSLAIGLKNRERARDLEQEP